MSMSNKQRSARGHYTGPRYDWLQVSWNDHKELPVSLLEFKIHQQNGLSSISREYLFKVLVLGEPSTGKTSFIKRYINQFFQEAYRETMGLDIASKTLLYHDKALVRLQFWDITGEERFGLKSWRRLYEKGPAGAFLVFDVTRRDTFQSLMKWKLNLDTTVPGTAGILLANKCNLADETEETNEQILEDFAR